VIVFFQLKYVMVVTMTVTASRMNFLSLSVECTVHKFARLLAARLVPKLVIALVTGERACRRQRLVTAKTTIAMDCWTRILVVWRVALAVASLLVGQPALKIVIVLATGERVRLQLKLATAATMIAMVSLMRILPVGRAALAVVPLPAAQQVLAPVRHLALGEPVHLRLKVVATDETTTATVQSTRDAVLT
jgi:hypothetical protein